MSRLEVDLSTLLDEVGPDLTQLRRLQSRLTEALARVTRQINGMEMLEKWEARKAAGSEPQTSENLDPRT